MTYDQHMTTEYDARFKNVKELKWYPWVGKHYHKTGIFVVGTSTDQRDGEDWTQNKKWNLGHPRNASRALVAWISKADETPFEYKNSDKRSSFAKMANTFIDHVNAARDSNAYAAFWSAVAFTNFIQVAVKNIGDWPERDIEENSKRAFYRVCEIIKPKVVLFWENDIQFLWPGHRHGNQKIGRVTPQIVEPENLSFCPAIVGIGHVSRMKQSDCRDFLLKEPVSKEPVKNLFAHLKQRVN